MLQLDTITGPVQMFTATSLKGKASLETFMAVASTDRLR
jgi:hypothetical protein